MTVSDKNLDKLFPDDRNDEPSIRAHQRRRYDVARSSLAPRRLDAHRGISMGSTGFGQCLLLYRGSVGFRWHANRASIVLFSYRGYKNEYYVRDRATAIIAGSAAVLVAFSPTAAPKGSLALSWWPPRTGMIHLLSAVVLFGSLIFSAYSSFQYPMSIRRASRGQKVAE